MAVKAVVIEDVPKEHDVRPMQSSTHLQPGTCHGSADTNLRLAGRAHAQQCTSGSLRPRPHKQDGYTSPS